MVDWEVSVQALETSSLARGEIADDHSSLARGEIADDQSREIGKNLLGGRLKCLELCCVPTGGNV